MRIFIALGTHPQQFDRLLEKIDSLAESKKIKAEIFAQTGSSAYEPKNFGSEKFLPPEEFSKEFEKADVIISHGGAGAIINALEFKKPLIIVPRLKKFGEHTDDHQIDLAKAMHERKKAIAVFDLGKLPEAIGKAEHFRAEKESERNSLVKRLEKFIGEGK
ncbi:MAG: glycosyltransferase [Candidatus Diapherotrites archaeon]|nr:glycosyltransferase [Candidatus Diapherotrites archaeon]